jgi:hypothetical protein
MYEAETGEKIAVHTYIQPAVRRRQQNPYSGSRVCHCWCCRLEKSNRIGCETIVAGGRSVCVCVCVCVCVWDTWWPECSDRDIWCSGVAREGILADEDKENNCWWRVYPARKVVGCGRDHATWGTSLDAHGASEQHSALDGTNILGVVSAARETAAVDESRKRKNTNGAVATPSLNRRRHGRLRRKALPHG